MSSLEANKKLPEKVPESESVLTKGQTCMSEMQALGTACIAQRLASTQEALEPISQGGQDGSCWRSGIAAQCSWAEIVTGSTDLIQNRSININNEYKKGKEAQPHTLCQHRFALMQKRTAQGAF